jgi:hypothetical protein
MNIEHRAHYACICGNEWPCPHADRTDRCIAVTAKGKACPNPARYEGQVCRVHWVSGWEPTA